jgi:hypothetical protein
LNRLSYRAASCFHWLARRDLNPLPLVYQTNALNPVSYEPAEDGGVEPHGQVTATSFHGAGPWKGLPRPRHIFPMQRATDSNRSACAPIRLRNGACDPGRFTLHATLTVRRTENSNPSAGPAPTRFPGGDRAPAASSSRCPLGSGRTTCRNYHEDLLHGEYLAPYSMQTLQPEKTLHDSGERTTRTPRATPRSR